MKNLEVIEAMYNTRREILNNIEYNENNAAIHFETGYIMALEMVLKIEDINFTINSDGYIKIEQENE